MQFSDRCPILAADFDHRSFHRGVFPNFHLWSDCKIDREKKGEANRMTVDISKMRSTPPGYFTVRWGLPEYTDWIDESMSWKETCYIGDWSFLWERRFRGPDVLKLFSDISVNNFARFDIGQSKHVIHEGILSRLDTEELLLFGRGCFWADYNLRHGKYNATSEPDDLFNLQVSGPNAIYLLEKACGQSLRDVKFMHSGKIKIAGVEMLALRQG